MYNIEIEYEIISKISDLLSHYEEYQIIPNNERFSGEYVCDAFIYKRNVLIAVVEIINKIEENIPHKNIISKLSDYAHKINASYFILCDSGKGLLYKVNDDKKKISLNTLENIIITIVKSINISETDFNPNEILLTFKELKKEFPTDNEQFDDFIEKLDEEDIKKYILRLPDNRFSLHEDFERLFFTKMLINREFDQLCRYTSLSSTIRIINEKKASVCSIACMNDKSECYYFDRYINDNNNIDSYSLSPLAIKEINNTFISSCAEIGSKDKLTMWRMYGDDAKGSCIIYNIDKDLKKNNFFIAPISYAYEDKRHPYIDFIKRLMEKNICFNQLYIWKHFFKPVEYKDEKEIRLLYFCNDEKKFKWIQSSDGIFCPIIEFSIEDGKNEFPLIIKEIILGPKCPEKITNRQQLQQYCSNNKLPQKINITLSKIDNYR